MQDFQQRVVDEKTELDEKISKLVIFMGGSIWPSLDEDERSRLIIQLDYMTGYQGILGTRIAAFK